MTKICRHLFRIISIQKNKQEGQTTFRRGSTIGNVRHERFSVFFIVQSGSDSNFSLIFWILGSISGTYKFLIAQLQASTESFLDVE